MTRENPDPDTGEVNLIDPAFASCPQPVYKRLREHFPVAKTAMMGHPVISRYTDVVWALRHPEIFSSEMDVHVALGTDRPMIPQQIDPPAQTRYRKILDSRFSRKRMTVIEPDIRQHANELIDEFIEAGECEFNTAFAIPLPCTAFLRLMGLPVDQMALFLELKDGIIRPNAPPGDIEKATEMRVESGKRIYAYFENLIAERTDEPRDDMITYLTTTELDGRKLTTNETLDICFLFLLGGLDTVTASLGCSIAYLASNPVQRRRLVDDPSVTADAVEEMLRWETPVAIVPRLVKKNVTIGEVELEAGSLVNLLLGAADTDDDEFEDAQCVNFDREKNRHVAFGAGPHRCLGSHLARMELRVALQEWHRRIPEYSIAAGEVPRYSPGIREVQYLPLVWQEADRK